MNFCNSGDTISVRSLVRSQRKIAGLFLGVRLERGLTAIDQDHARQQKHDAACVADTTFCNNPTDPEFRELESFYRSTKIN